MKFGLVLPDFRVSFCDLLDPPTLWNYLITNEEKPKPHHLITNPLVFILDLHFILLCKFSFQLEPIKVDISTSCTTSQLQASRANMLERVCSEFFGSHTFEFCADVPTGGVVLFS